MFPGPGIVKAKKGNIMTRNATHENLEQKVRELEKEPNNHNLIEKALRESEERYKQLYENVPVGVYRTNYEGKILSANPAAIKIWGYDSEEDLLARNITEVYEEPEKRRRFLERLIKNEKVEEYEVKFKRKDGSTFWGSLSATMVEVKDDVDSFYIDGILRDISAQKRIQRLRDNVYHMMRHDLKSPLMGIAGLARLLLKDDNLTEKHFKTISMITETSERMLGYIDRKRDLFQMEEGKYKITPQEVNLFSILKKVEKELSILALKGSINFKYTILGRNTNMRSKYMIVGEEKLLEVMFANLIKNAIEASPEGGDVNISVESIKNKKHAFHAIHIHNMGAVPMDIRKNFFEPYVSSGKKNGTGLGTHIALLIAQAHKGDINFTASEANETQITVLLPFTDLEHYSI